jgi:hypothetical protein
MSENNLNNLATDIMESRPEPTPEAENIIADARAEQAAENLGEIPPGIFPEPQGNGNPMVDNAGTEWNEETHLNPPTKTKQGLWMRRRGVKAGTKLGSNSQQVSAYPVDPLRAQCTKAAEDMVGKLFILGRAIGGDEWAPIKDEANGIDEKAQITEAVFDFMMDRGKAWKLPSWFALPIVIFSYGSIRLMNLEHFPKTKTRWESFKGWFNRKFLGGE